MRFPVFARRANPSVDAPILRKSKTYIEQQVAEGRADYVDPADPRKGIVCRELLHFGHRPLAPEPQTSTYSPVELPGLRYMPPASDLHAHSARNARLDWNWMREPWPNDLLRLSPDPRSPQAAATLPTQNSAYDSGELPL
jgi:hypothetical protein